LLARRARLEAEERGYGKLTFPQVLTGSKSPSAAEAMRQEARLFATRQSEEVQIRAQLQDRIEALNRQIEGYNAQIAALDKQAVLIGPELEGLRSLWERKLVTINRLNALERDAAALEGSRASLVSNIAQTNARISETREQLVQLGQSRRIEAADSLQGVNAALNDVQVRSVAASDRLDNSTIRAPYAGVVEKLAYTTIGDVVRPAEPIMEIVPSGELTVVEAMVSPADVDQVLTGQDARIRFTAFAYSSTPEIPGKVTYVATDSTVDQASGMTYFVVRIAIDGKQLKQEGMELRSGMPAEVYISTGSRSLLSYLSRPLRDQFNRSFRGE
jgi:HlyD family type I secretion membrane fusion protein